MCADGKKDVEEAKRKCVRSFIQFGSQLFRELTESAKLKRYMVVSPPNIT